MARFYFNCTGGRSYRDDGFPLADNSGYWQGNEWDEDGGNWRSIILFNSTTIRSTLANYRITQCLLDHYVTYVEETQAILGFGTHNYTSVPSQWQSSRVNANRVSYIKYGPGRVSNLSLGTTIGNELKDGVSTGIAFGPVPFYLDDHDNLAKIQPFGATYQPVLIIDGESLNVAPLAPTLNEPAAGAVVDLDVAGGKFKWTHADPNGDAQSAWYFRRKKPNGTYDYWNGTAFQSTAFRLTTATAPLTNGFMNIPPAVWGAAGQYTWSVATEDPTGLVGAYSAERIVWNSRPPVTTITEPSTSQITTSRPTVRWTFADPDSDAAQYGWAVQIVEPGVYNDPSWSPDQYVRQFWSTSGQSSTDRAVQVGKDLLNHRTYRAYVRTGSSPSPAGGIQYSPWAFQQFEVVVAPYAPTMIYPENGSVADLGNGFTMEWRNNFFSGIGTLSAFAIRRQVGTGPYQWWSGSAWVSTETFLPSTNPTYAFRPGEIPNGQTYTFSMAIRDDYGQVSPYSSPVTVTASSAAQVTVTQPTGVTTISNPIIAWSMYDLENDPQQKYQVRVIESSQYAGLTTFDPGALTAVWDSGEVNSATTRTVALPIDLVNGSTYRVYIRVMTSGIYSGWSYSEFNITLIPPATPAATVEIVEDAGAIDIIVQGRDSMLNEDASRSFGRWVAQDNSVVTNGIVFSSSNSKFIGRVTSNAAGTMTARTQDKYPVAEGFTYTAAVSFIAALGMTPLNSYVSIEWLDINEVIIAVSSPLPALDEAAIRSSVSGVAPTLATHARVRVTFQSAPTSGQAHGFFDPVLRPGVGDEWSAGGTLGDTFVSVVEATGNKSLRRGLNVPVPIETQRVVIRDEEAEIGRQQIYRVTVRAVYPNAALVSSPLVLDPVTWTSGYLWLSDPLRPGSARAFGPQGFDAITRPVRQGKFRPIGRPDAIITTGVRGLREGAFTIVTHTREERNAFLDIVEKSETVLLRIPPDTADPRVFDPEGDTIYVRLEGDAPEDRPMASRTPHRTIKQAWTEQLRPLTNLEWEG